MSNRSENQENILDPSLCEIDDLIIPYDDMSHICFVSDSVDHWLESNHEFKIRYNVKYIKVMEQSTKEDIDRYKTKILSHLSRLSKTWGVTNTCLALKIMRIAFEKDTNWLRACDNIKFSFSNFLKGDENTIILDQSLIDAPQYLTAWLSKLKNIPLANCPKKKRIALWIRRQSEIILECMYIGWFSNFEHKFSTWELQSRIKIPQSYISFLNGSQPCFLKMDYLHSYFMSASDENERVKLVESFVRGCFEGGCKSCDYLDIPTEINFFGFIRKLATYLTSHLCRGIKVDYDKHLQAEWSEIERYHGYHVEPYLPENSSSTKTQNSISQQRSDYYKDSLNSKNNKPDFTIERYLYYDDVIKYLEVMSILHTAFLRSADIIKMKRFPDYYETLIFRITGPRKTNVIGDYFSDLLFNSKKHAPLWMQAVLKICPFLVFSQQHEYLRNDLLKFLKGDEVDEATLEELYFAVTSVPKFEEIY